MKKILFLTGVFVCCNIAAYTQQIFYTYDAAGNRISRIIVLPDVRSARANAEVAGEEPEMPPYTDELGELQIKIYPNPTKGHLRVDIANLAERQTAAVQVYDLRGQMLMQVQNISQSTTLNLSEQPKGTYLLKITAGGKTATWKIIKE